VRQTGKGRMENRKRSGSRAASGKAGPRKRGVAGRDGSADLDVGRGVGDEE